MRFQVTPMLKKEKFSEVEVVEMGAAAIDQLSSLLEADHQVLRKYLAEKIKLTSVYQSCIQAVF